MRSYTSSQAKNWTFGGALFPRLKRGSRTVAPLPPPYVTSRKIHQNKLLAKNIFQNIFIAELDLFRQFIARTPKI
jgi:hypothetical protein